MHPLPREVVVHHRSDQLDQSHLSSFFDESSISNVKSFSKTGISIIGKVENQLDVAFPLVQQHKCHKIVCS